VRIGVAAFIATECDCNTLPRFVSHGDGLINGTAKIWITFNSFTSSAGRAKVEDTEIISTSNPSLAKPPVSFARHIDAIVPDVNNYTIRNGRAAAAWDSGAAVKASSNMKIVESIRRKDALSAASENH